MSSQLLASDFLWMNWFERFNAFDHDLASKMGNTVISGDPVTTVSPLIIACMVSLVILALIAATRVAWATSGDNGVAPPSAFSARAFLEGILDACLNFGEMVFGSKKASRRFLPLIGALGVYIFLSNILGLLPFFAQSTSSLNITVGPAIVVFFVTHYIGIKEQGWHYAEHFLGPKIGGFWWLAPLFIPLEIISHLARPLSLALRLMGNMMGDHMVLGVFLGFGVLSIFAVPLPFYLLGLMVCTIQALVFCLLSMVYISLSLATDH